MVAEEEVQMTTEEKRGALAMLRYTNMPQPQGGKQGVAQCTACYGVAFIVAEGQDGGMSTGLKLVCRGCNHEYELDEALDVLDG